MRQIRVLAVFAAALAAASLIPLAVSAAPARQVQTYVFNGGDNRLNAYDVSAGFKKQTVIPSPADAPLKGKDINPQICFSPDGSRRFIAGEDTGQGNTGHPGWGIFQLSGDRIGRFSAQQVG